MANESNARWSILHANVQTDFAGEFLGSASLLAAISLSCCPSPVMARRVRLPVLLAVLSSLLVLSPPPCSCASTAAVIFRGVAPQDKALYSGKTVTCRDGSKTIPIAKVNDDFCDCADGTDEPGTSACPTSKFYCRNRGHEPTLLFSSRVNDGICDCCDGSDEWDGWVRCNATCAEAGAEARKELAALVHKYSEGSKLRDAVVAGAAEKRKQWEEEKATLEAEKAELEQKEHTLKDGDGGSAGGDGGSSSPSRDVTLSAHGGQNKDTSSSSSSSNGGGSAGGSSSSSGSKTLQYLWVLLQVGGVWVVLLAVSLACYCVQQQRRAGGSRRRGRGTRRKDGSTLPLHF